MKYRRNKVKREHGIIQNALMWLENLGRLSDVTNIIPGVIEVSHSSERGIVYKYETQTGCKILLKSNGSIQEAFVITNNPARVLEWVEKEFPSDTSVSKSPVMSHSSIQEGSRRKLSNDPAKPKQEAVKKSFVASARHAKKRKTHGQVSKTTFGNLKAMNISDQLDVSTRKALGHLKKNLESVKIQNAKTKFNRF